MKEVIGMKILIAILRTFFLTFLLWLFLFSVLAIVMPEDWGKKLDPYFKDIAVGFLILSFFIVYSNRTRHKHFPVLSFLLWSFLGILCLGSLGIVFLNIDMEKTWCILSVMALSSLISAIAHIAKPLDFYYKQEGKFASKQKARVNSKGLFLGKHLLSYRDIAKATSEKGKLTIEVRLKASIGEGLSYFLDEKNCLVLKTDEADVSKWEGEIRARLEEKEKIPNEWEIKWRVFFIAKILLWAGVFYCYLVIENISLPLKTFLILLHTLQWVDLYSTLLIPFSPSSNKIFPLFWSGDRYWKEKIYCSFVSIFDDPIVQGICITLATAPFVGTKEPFYELNGLLYFLILIRFALALYQLFVNQSKEKESSKVSINISSEYYQDYEDYQDYEKMYREQYD